MMVVITDFLLKILIIVLCIVIEIQIVKQLKLMTLELIANYGLVYHKLAQVQRNMVAIGRQLVITAFFHNWRLGGYTLKSLSYLLGSSPPAFLNSILEQNIFFSFILRRKVVQFASLLISFDLSVSSLVYGEKIVFYFVG